MDTQQLLTGSRWEILQQLARRPQSTSELAEHLGTTQANISQQIKQLELAGYVVRVRAENSRVHYHYEITDETLHFTYLSPRTALKKTLRLDDMQRLLAGLLLHKNGVCIMTLLLSRPELTRRLLALGVLSRDQPELFFIAEHVDDIRREHANITLQTVEGEKRIIIWSHTLQEVKDGLLRTDAYFGDALRSIDLLYDPKGELLTLKKQAEKKL